MADKDNTTGKIDFEPIVISSGETESSPLDLRGMTVCGMYLPPTLTSVLITFMASDNLTGTYLPIADGAGTVLSKVIAQGHYIKLEPVDFAGVRYIKLVGGSTEPADREIKLALRQV